MRKNFGAKPFLYPMPVLIIAAYDENEVANAMNAAWGTICDMNQIALFLSADHKTVKNIMKRKAFTVSMADMDNVIPADYVGIVSGNDVPEKVERAGWHVTRSEFVDAPIINELPITLECKFVSYDEESECMIGEIINVSAEERILGEDGKIDLSKFHPICYDPMRHDYVTLGQKVGNAFKDGKNIK